MHGNTDLPCARQEVREVGESAVPEQLLYKDMLEQTFQLSLDDGASCAVVSQDIRFSTKWIR